MPKQERVKLNNPSFEFQSKNRRVTRSKVYKASAREPHEASEQKGMLEKADLIPESFAEGFYALDRASEASAYCDYIDQLMSLIGNLCPAIERKNQKQIASLLPDLKARIHAWPECFLLDVTEEHGEKLVHQISTTLDGINQCSSADISLAALAGMLRILQHEHDSASQYREPVDD